jgi:hypothetical protein
MTATGAYDCEGCGVHVVGLGRDAPRVHQLCAVCERLNMRETPERIMDGCLSRAMHRERRATDSAIARR